MSEKELKIREVCGDYALDIPFADGSVNTIYFNSKQNAETVKHIIEVDGSNTVCEMSEESFYKDVKNGVEQAMKECELTIGMTLKEAVEKQIPKRLKICTRSSCNRDSIREAVEYNCLHSQDPIPMPKYKEWKWTDYQCPVCNFLVKDGKPNYCYNCGQVLDWSTAKAVSRKLSARKNITL